MGTPFPPNDDEATYSVLKEGTPQKQHGKNRQSAQGYNDTTDYFNQNSARKVVGFDLPEGYEDKKTERTGTPFPPQNQSHEQGQTTVGFQLPETHQDRRTLRQGTPYPPQ